MVQLIILFSASILFTQKQEGEVELELTGSIIELLKEEKDDENVYRFLMAIGTLVRMYKKCLYFSFHNIILDHSIKHVS
jgi:phospholipase A-2-activating protein